MALWMSLDRSQNLTVLKTNLGTESSIRFARKPT